MPLRACAGHDIRYYLVLFFCGFNIVQTLMKNSPSWPRTSRTATSPTTFSGENGNRKFNMLERTQRDIISDVLEAP
jgi:hypothetical protein